jgi:hypothetical protein
MIKLLLPTVLIICASCATIVSKSVYNVHLNSSPEQAYVQVFDRSGREVFNGNTPTQVALKSGAGYFKRAEYTVKYSKPGYLPKEVMIRSDLNGWYIGNIVFGGLIGFLIVDPATGAMYRLDQTDLNETLAPQTQSTTSISNGEKTLHIVELSQIPEKLRSSLVLVK